MRVMNDMTIGETDRSMPTFDSAITRMFGVRLPIICSGLQWLSEAHYVAAASRAGALAFLTSRSFADPAELAEQIDTCRELSGGMTFGVNLGLSARFEGNKDLVAVVETALDKGVIAFETSGTPPDRILPRLKEAGAVVIHKCAKVRHALHAEKLGVDAVSIVGAEAGGHPGAGTPATMVQIGLAARSLTIPYAIGGGIGHGAQVLGVLAAGADAVIMGSRLLVAEEIRAHGDYKNKLLTCDETSSVPRLESLGDTWRVLDNATSRKVAELELAGVQSKLDFGALIQGRTTRDNAYAKGDWDTGMVSLGPSIAFAEKRQTVAQILGEVMQQATDAWHRAQSLGVRDRTAP